MATFSAEQVSNLIKTGEFGLALRFLQSQRAARASNVDLYDILDAELSFYVGDDVRAIRVSEE
jgi:hypothetical protein